MDVFGKRLIFSVPSPALALGQLRLPRASKRAGVEGETSRLAAGPGHRMSAPQKSSSRLVGLPTGCWLHLVDEGAWGSAASCKNPLLTDRSPGVWAQVSIVVPFEAFTPRPAAQAPRPACSPAGGQGLHTPTSSSRCAPPSTIHISRSMSCGASADLPCGPSELNDIATYAGGTQGAA